MTITPPPQPKPSSLQPNSTPAGATAQGQLRVVLAPRHEVLLLLLPLITMMMMMMVVTMLLVLVAVVVVLLPMLQRLLESSKTSHCASVLEPCLDPCTCTWVRLRGLRSSEPGSQMESGLPLPKKGRLQPRRCCLAASTSACTMRLSLVPMPSACVCSRACKTGDAWGAQGVQGCGRVAHSHARARVLILGQGTDHAASVKM